MKTVYFVRHGESQGNKEQFGQSISTPLTDVGHQQASIIAARTSQIKFNLLVASHLTRAHQTAETIAKQSGLPITTSELFAEKRRPKACQNVSHSDLESNRINEEWWQNFGNPDYQTDGETYFDLLSKELDGPGGGCPTDRKMSV